MDWHNSEKSPLKVQRSGPFQQAASIIKTLWGRYILYILYMMPRFAFKVCDFVNAGANVFWIDEQQVPYAVSGNQWIGFDDVNSLRNKVGFVNK